MNELFFPVEGPIRTRREPLPVPVARGISADAGRVAEAASAGSRQAADGSKVTGNVLGPVSPGPGSFDGLPYMGRLPGMENAYVAAGHFRSGLYLSSATAVVMGQLMRGEVQGIDL